MGFQDVADSGFEKIIYCQDHEQDKFLLWLESLKKIHWPYIGNFA